MLLGILTSASCIGYTQIRNGECNCIEQFDRDIRTDFTEVQRNSFKDFLYQYFSSTEKQRKSMKKSSSSSFGLDAVVKKLPVKFSFGSDKSSDGSFMYFQQQKAINSGYVTDDQFVEIVTSFIPNRSWDSYDKCLEVCGGILMDQSGIIVSTTYKSDERVQIKVTVDKIQGDKVTIDKTSYIGGQAMGGKTLFNGRILKEGSTVFEDIKRNIDQDLTISISFKESWVGALNETFESTQSEIKGDKKAPIGSIIVSILSYDSFLEINEIERTSDMSKAVWVPCDGRPVSGSKYGNVATKVPDLRGVFIRGINDMGVQHAQVGTVNPRQANPDNKVAGSFQSDAIRNIVGQFGNGDDNFPVDNRLFKMGGNAGDASHHGNPGRYVHFDASRVVPTAKENRPKNVTVYYYIKIN